MQAISKLLNAIFGRLPTPQNLGDKAKGELVIGKLDVRVEDIKESLPEKENVIDLLIQIHNDRLKPFRDKVRNMLHKFHQRGIHKFDAELKAKEAQVKPWPTVSEKRNEYLYGDHNSIFSGEKKESKSSIERNLEDYKKYVVDNIVPDNLLQTPIPFIIPYSSRSKHCLVVGGSGSGKSEMLKQFVHYDLNQAKSGVLLLDPHGDISIQSLAFNSPDEQFIYISAEYGNRGLYPKYNPFEHEYHTSKRSIKLAYLSTRTSELITAFSKILGSSYTPNMDRLLYHCLQLLSLIHI